MVRFVIVNKTKEKALEMRDHVCASLVGIPGFVNNDIVVSSQLVDSSGNQTSEDGDMEWDGEKHCVLLTLDSPQINLIKLRIWNSGSICKRISPGIIPGDIFF